MAMTTSTKIEAWEDKHSVQMKVTPKDGQPIMSATTDRVRTAWWQTCRRAPQSMASRQA